MMGCSAFRLLDLWSSSATMPVSRALRLLSARFLNRSEECLRSVLISLTERFDSRTVLRQPFTGLPDLSRYARSGVIK